MLFFVLHVFVVRAVEACLGEVRLLSNVVFVAEVLVFYAFA